MLRFIFIFIFFLNSIVFAEIVVSSTQNGIKHFNFSNDTNVVKDLAGVKNVMVKMSKDDSNLENPAVVPKDFGLNSDLNNPFVVSSNSLLVYHFNHKNKSFELLNYIFENGKLKLNKNFSKLTKDDVKIINFAPSWMRLRLFLILSNLNDFTKKQILDFILKISKRDDAKDIIDEALFPIAWSSPETLEVENFNPEIFLDNAIAIYKIIPHLKYVNFVEKGNELTTLKYKTKVNDTIVEKEISPWVYYMFVVHTKLDGEDLLYIDPFSGLFASKENGGIDFRSNFWNPIFDNSYVPHYILENPFNLKKDDFKKDDSFEATAVFDKNSIDPLKILFIKNKPVMVETDQNKGTVIATSIDVENLNNDNLLTNLLNYGNKDADIIGKTLVLGENTNEKTLVLNRIKKMKREYASCVVDNFKDIVLIKDKKLVFRKILIPSNQSEKFYQDLQLYKDKINEFIDNGGVFELHLHSSFDNCKYINNIFSVGCSFEKVSDSDIVFSGHPTMQSIANSDILWNEKSYRKLGDEPLDKDADAFQSMGYWVNQNMFSNISERRFDGGNVERAIQAVRVAKNHYGNCGENEDMVGSASKTLAIPEINVLDSAEDHVWNELFTTTKWIPMQSIWSDYGIDINMPGKICMEKKFSANHKSGKDISYVFAWRADDNFFNRTAEYTDTITLNLTVLTKNHKPVSNAQILIATENYYDKTKLTVAGVALTNEEGKAKLILGDNRNYFFQIQTETLGTYPSLQNVSQFIKKEDAVPNKVFEKTITLTSVLPNIVEISSSKQNYDTKDSVFVLGNVLLYNYFKNLFTSRKVFNAKDFTPSIFALSVKEFDMLSKTGKVEALKLKLNQKNNLPLNQDWYFVLNSKQQQAGLFVGDIAFNVETGEVDDDSKEILDDDFINDEDVLNAKNNNKNDSSGCSCSLMF